MSIKEVEAYASSASVEQGKKVALHVRVRTATNCRMTVKRHSTGEQVFEHQFPVEKFGWNSFDIDAAAYGCNWPVAYELEVPSTWPSDIYLAEISVNNDKAIVPLIVRARVPTSSILLKAGDTTTQAYNSWGGQNLYNREPQSKSVQISFDRPYVLVGHKYSYWYYELRFLNWCHLHNIQVDVCSSVDVHSGAVDLSKYNLMVSAGHDEYWSKETRDSVEHFIQHGGHVCFFSGCTCLWQIRFERNCRQMIGYKELAAKDPLVHTDPRRVTGLWAAHPTNRPENEMTCVSYRNGGGWWGDISEENRERRFGKEFSVSRPNHWVFEGTGLTLNDTFGKITGVNGTPDTIIGHETDSARYIMSDEGIPVVTGEDGTPSDAVILAYCDLSDWPAEIRIGQPGKATVVIRELPNGGVVFSAGTVNWCGGLTESGTSAVDRITQNLLERLKKR